MGVDLRLYLVEKEELETKSKFERNEYIFVNPIMALNMVRRSELFVEIERYSLQHGKELPCSLLADFNREQHITDRYKQKLRYLTCEEVAKLVSEYNEPYRGWAKKHRNDAIAEMISNLDDQCYCVLYWH